jgi:hypothetical protein
VQDLSVELKARQQALDQLQRDAERSHAELASRHEAEMADVRSMHQHVITELQAGYDSTQCKLAAALAENGVKSARIAEAGDALAACEAKLCQMQEALGSELNHLQVLALTHRLHFKNASHTLQLWYPLF